MHVRDIQAGPTVSVVLTACRRAGAAAALRSALAQTHRDLQVLVVGAGEPGGLAGLGDPRVRRLAGCGGPAGAALCRGARAATGKYVCYLDAGAAYHRHHVRTLVEALEASSDCGAAYGEVYRTTRRALPDGSRPVLGKVVHDRRDFDRFFLLHCEHVPLTGLMHRRSLLGRAGGFNERLDRLAAWDFCRRLALFTDFLHVASVTGEVYVDVPPGEAAPEDAEQPPAAELREVRSARPPKPWPKMADLSIVLAPEPPAGERAAGRIAELREHLYVPCRFYLADPAGPSRPADGVACLRVGRDWPWDARVDKAVRCCDGDCIAVVPPAGETTAAEITSAFHALVRHARSDEAILLGRPRPGAWGAVFRREQLLRARDNWPALPIRRAAEADGVVLRPAEPDELPFAFERGLRAAGAAEADGSFRQAAGAYEALGREHGQVDWMNQAAAESLYRAGRQDEPALTLCRRANAASPSVSGLLLEARLLRRNGRAAAARRMLERAKGILDWTPNGKEQPC